MANQNNYFENVHLSNNAVDELFAINESDSYDDFNSENLHKSIANDLQLNCNVDVEYNQNFIYGEIPDEILFDQATPDPNFFDNLISDDESFNLNPQQCDVELSLDQDMSFIAPTVNFLSFKFCSELF